VNWLTRLKRLTRKLSRKPRPHATGTPRPDANPYCMRCGDSRGGPGGHETNECTWGRGGEATP
jgi:hypothetical protein